METTPNSFGESVDLNIVWKIGRTALYVYAHYNYVYVNTIHKTHTVRYDYIQYLPIRNLVRSVCSLFVCVV